MKVNKPKITLKNQKLVTAYIDNGGNGTQAAIDAGYNVSKRSSATKIAYQVLNKPSVREYLELHAEKAAQNIAKMADDAENEAVRLNANKDILDRAGYKPIDRAQNVNVNVDANDPEIVAKAKSFDEWFSQQP